MKMVNVFREAYRIIEKLCDVHLGVGDKLILKKILQNGKEKNDEENPWLFSDRTQYIIRQFSCFFPEHKGFERCLKRIEEGEADARYCYTHSGGT